MVIGTDLDQHTRHVAGAGIFKAFVLEARFRDKVVTVGGGVERHKICCMALIQVR